MDDQWNLYQTLIYGNDIIDNNIITDDNDDITDDFLVINEESLRVSYSSLPHLDEINNNDNNSIWYMNEILYNNNINENIKKEDNLIKNKKQEQKRTKLIPLNNNENNEYNEYKIDSVVFSISNEFIEFVFVNISNNKDNDDNNTLLGKLPSDIIDNPIMIKAMTRYVHLAKGAYALNDIQLRERSGLDHSQIYHFDFQESSGEFPRPAFYLAVDESLQALILCIRGTKTTLEFKIDAQWTPIEFPQYPNAFVHKGIFLAARWFIDNVLGRIIKLLELFPNYKVRIVGHSLGGGIAALFTLMVKDVISNVKAIIFAPPACISANLLPLCNECCVSFVNRSDILPYITHANFTSLFSNKRIIDSIEGFNIQNKSEYINNNQNKYINNALIQFYPPGILHHIFKSIHNTFHLRKVSHDYFQSFGVSKSMIRHHKLDSYKNAFEQMSKNC